MATTAAMVQTTMKTANYEKDDSAEETEKTIWKQSETVQIFQPKMLQTNPQTIDKQFEN